MEISKKDQKLVVKTLNHKGEESLLTASHVLLAVGRRAHTQHLNSEALGIETDRHGFRVDENFMTTKEGVYAVGDCIGGEMLAHRATYQSLKVVNHLLNLDDGIDLTVLPSCVFTFPEIASVGITEAQAKEGDAAFKMSKALYRANGKANAMGEEEGFVKLISQNNRLVGAHIIGEAASTIIHQATLLIDQKIPITTATEMIHAHPTLSEVLLDALRKLIA